MLNWHASVYINSRSSGLGFHLQITDQTIPRLLFKSKFPNSLNFHVLHFFYFKGKQRDLPFLGLLPKRLPQPGRSQEPRSQRQSVKHKDLFPAGSLPKCQAWVRLRSGAWELHQDEGGRDPNTTTNTCCFLRVRIGVGTLNLRPPTQDAGRGTQGFQCEMRSFQAATSPPPGQTPAPIRF